MKVAGLSIEGSRLKVSIIQNVLGLRKALYSEEIELPSSEEEKQALIRERLIKWKKDYGIKAITIGLEFKDFSYHFVELPLKRRQDIGNALRFEMERYLPLPPEEYLYDFSVIEQTKQGSITLILAIKRERLGWLHLCLKDTGLNVLGIRAGFIEALNEFISLHTMGNIILLYHAKGGMYYIAGLKSSLIQSFRVIEENSLMVEMERLTRDFPDGIYTVGALNIEALNIKSLPFSTANLIALSAFKKRHIALNFLPQELMIRKLDYYPYAAGIISAVSIIIFIAGTILAYYKDYTALKKVEVGITEIKKTASGLIDVKKELEGIDERKQFLLNFQSKANTSIKVLRELSAIMPSQAWLTGFSSEANKIEIKGYAKKSADIIEPLEKSAFFKKVEFSTAITKKEDMESFSLRMEIEE